MSAVTLEESGIGAAERSVGALVGAAARALARISSTPRLDAELLLAHAAGISRSEVIAFPERCLSGETEAGFRAAFARRARGEPLAYIRGSKEFHDILLRVTRDVLIPRPETELMVDEALARIDAAWDSSVLDLGTGSGAIALAIKRARPHAAVTAVDASSAAVDIARENAKRLGLELRCLESRWFDALETERFDLIVCNPPYVQSGDPHFDGGLRFEPRVALDGGADGLDAIRAVLSGARFHLDEHGLLLIEHGYDQAGRVVTLAGERGFETVATRRDLSGLPRLVLLRARRA